MTNLIWTIIVILFALWVAGLVFSIGGPLIHIILVLCLVLVVFNVLTRGRATL